MLYRAAFRKISFIIWGNFLAVTYSPNVLLMEERKNSHLVALRLSNPPEETIKLPNPANPSKPGIVFPYSKQRHLSRETAKEDKNKCDYLTRAITENLQQE
jgi:hypothetical protein